MHHKTINSEFFHLFNLKIDKEMLEVGLFQLFVCLGQNLVKLSLIFHMYQNLNYEIWQIFAFYFLFQLGFVLTNPFVGYLIQKVGLKHGISSRGFGNIVFYVFLPFFLQADFYQSMLLLIPIFLLQGVLKNMSNISYDIFLAHHLNKKNKGEVVAWLQIAMMFAAIVAPVAGAVITKFFGFNIVIYVGILFMVISSVILYLTPDEKFPMHYTPKKLISDVFYKTPKSLFLAEWGRVFFETILWVLWPIFLILVLKDVLSMGILIGASSFFAMILAYLVGKRIDTGKTSPANILKWGAWRSTGLNFFRAIWFEPVSLSIIDALSQVNDQTIQIPYNTEVYKWTHEKDTFERAHIRRILSEVFFTISLLVFVIAFMCFPHSPCWLFVLIFSVGAFSLSLTAQISKVTDMVEKTKIKTAKVLLKVD
ncbi:MFS transporter [Candidatus Gracilibacteria bacterium]|nr:MFS transporter [Candidatus Gracilibacteria bacterium]